MVVDDHLRDGQARQEGCEIAKLIFGSGVEDDHRVNIAPSVARQRKALDRLGRIEKVIPRWPSAGNERADGFAEMLQRLPQGQERSQPVAIGANMGRQQKSLMFAHEADKRSPIERHNGPFMERSQTRIIWVAKQLAAQHCANQEITMRYLVTARVKPGKE